MLRTSSPLTTPPASQEAFLGAPKVSEPCRKRQPHKLAPPAGKPGKSPKASFSCPMGVTRLGVGGEATHHPGLAQIANREYAGNTKKKWWLERISINWFTQTAVVLPFPRLSLRPQIRTPESHPPIIYSSPPYISHYYHVWYRTVPYRTVPFSHVPRVCPPRFADTPRVSVILHAYTAEDKSTPRQQNTRSAAKEQRLFVTFKHIM